MVLLAAEEGIAVHPVADACACSLRTRAQHQEMAYKLDGTPAVF